jgi:hypothetical protein
MVTTKKINRKVKKWSNPNWSIGAVIVALFGTFLLLISLLSKPQFVILHHTVVLTQGIVAPAILMGAIAWALIEFYTAPGKGLEDLLVRIIPAFIIGAFVGGLLGYLFNFGKYVIDPAFNGNVDAVFFLVATLIAGLAITWNAAWSHTHGFRGQRANGSKKLNRHESGTSKGSRGILALLIIFVVALLIVPVGAGLGGLFVSGHDSSHVLVPESSTVYISGNSGPIPFGQVNGTTTFDFPSTTAHNITTYSHTVFLETNLTLRELNNFAVSQIVLSTSDSRNVNVTMGTGINSTNFVPIASVSEVNGSTIKIPISPALLTGNQSSRVTMEITANISSLSITTQVLGNNGLVTVLGSYSVMQFTYLLGGVLLLISAFVEISVYDIDIHAFGSMPVKKGGAKR